MTTLDDWAAGVLGTYVDMDGYAGNQCWDASQSWLSTIAPGCTLWTQPSTHPGLAAGCWEVATGDTRNGADLRQYVIPIPGDQPGQYGDVVIWVYGARLYPTSHTAVLIADNNDMLDCYSQNSSPGQPNLPGYSPESTGPVIRQQLPREGIAGFLRPNTLTPLSGTITPLGDTDVVTPQDITAIAAAVEDRIFNQHMIENHVVSAPPDTFHNWAAFLEARILNHIISHTGVLNLTDTQVTALANTLKTGLASETLAVFKAQLNK
jgi:hypothetical protein